MIDIVERLKDRRAVDGSVVYVEMTEQVLDDAIYEIERLRRLFIEAITVGQRAANSLQSFGNEMKDLFHD